MVSGAGPWVRCGSEMHKRAYRVKSQPRPKFWGICQAEAWGHQTGERTIESHFGMAKLGQAFGTNDVTVKSLYVGKVDSAYENHLYRRWQSYMPEPSNAATASYLANPCGRHLPGVLARQR